MRRWFAVNNECFAMATEMVTFLVLVLLAALALSTTVQAQGPALTTISEPRHRAAQVCFLSTATVPGNRARCRSRD